MYWNFTQTSLLLDSHPKEPTFHHVVKIGQYESTKGGDWRDQRASKRCGHCGLGGILNQVKNQERQNENVSAINNS